MAYKISLKQLNGAIDHLNNIASTPTEPYSKGKDGKYKPNANCYHLDGAYGGWQLAQMSSKEGCTGISHPLNTGYISKRECFDSIHHFISGMLVAQEKANLEKAYALMQSEQASV